MTAVRIIRTLLVTDADFAALVPAVRVISGLVPQGTSLPAVGITEVSRVDRNIVKPGETARCTSRIQVTVIAASYPVQKQVLAAVRHACRDKFGRLDSTAIGSLQAYIYHPGVPGVSVLTDGTGPDFSDAVTGFHMQSQDFKVSFTEPT